MVDQGSLFSSYSSIFLSLPRAVKFMVSSHSLMSVSGEWLIIPIMMIQSLYGDSDDGRNVCTQDPTNLIWEQKKEESMKRNDSMTDSTFRSNTQSHHHEENALLAY